MIVVMRNHSAFLNTTWLQAALDAVCPWELVDEFEVAVHEGKKNEGAAHLAFASIDITVNPRTQFPYVGPSHGEYLGIRTFSFEELFVWLAAHETRHIWQGFHSHLFPDTRPDAPGKERDADEHGARALKAFRHGALTIPGRATVDYVARCPQRPVYLPTAEAWAP